MPNFPSVYLELQELWKRLLGIGKEISEIKADIADGVMPSGPAGGILSGTYPNPSALQTTGSSPTSSLDIYMDAGTRIGFNGSPTPLGSVINFVRKDIGSNNRYTALKGYNVENNNDDELYEDSAGGVIIEGGNNENGSGGDVGLAGGYSADGGTGGDVLISGGKAANGDGGNIQIISGEGQSITSGGSVTIKTVQSGSVILEPSGYLQIKNIPAGGTGIEKLIGIDNTNNAHTVNVRGGNWSTPDATTIDPFGDASSYLQQGTFIPNISNLLYSFTEPTVTAFFTRTGNLVNVKIRLKNSDQFDYIGFNPGAYIQDLPFLNGGPFENTSKNRNFMLTSCTANIVGLTYTPVVSNYYTGHGRNYRIFLPTIGADANIDITIEASYYFQWYYASDS